MFPDVPHKVLGSPQNLEELQATQRRLEADNVSVSSDRSAASRSGSAHAHEDGATEGKGGAERRRTDSPEEFLSCDENDEDDGGQ